MALFFGGAERPFADPVSHLGREAGDRWGAAVAVVAAAHPSAFMDELPPGPPSLHVLVILGEVGDPRAVDVLLAHVRNRDWLVRYNVVAALRRHSGERALAGVEAALDDEEPVVRRKRSARSRRRSPSGRCSCTHASWSTRSSPRCCGRTSMAACAGCVARGAQSRRP